jgi:AcrR family transcriptional regulator
VLKKVDLTRAAILNESLKQGTIRGFQAVSLADLAQSTGLSKSAVFKHFGSKEGLELATIQKLCERFAEQVWLPASREPAGERRLDAIFSAWLDWVEAGCGIIQAQIEFDDQPGAVQKFLRTQQKLWARQLNLEFRTLGSADAKLSAFEFRGIVLSFNQAHRLMRDRCAHSTANAAYASLMLRRGNL